MNFKELVKKLEGRKVKRVSGLSKGSERVTIHLDQDETIIFEHFQDCCENVRLYDSEYQGKLSGDLLEIRETTNKKDGAELGDDSSTWTYYNVYFSDGNLNMRWLGESNGYYSERVDVSFGPEETRNWGYGKRQMVNSWDDDE